MEKFDDWIKQNAENYKKISKILTDSELTHDPSDDDGTCILMVFDDYFDIIGKYITTDDFTKTRGMIADIGNDSSYSKHFGAKPINPAFKA